MKLQPEIADIPGFGSSSQCFAKGADDRLCMYKHADDHRMMVPQRFAMLQCECLVTPRSPCECCLVPGGI